MAFNAEKLKQIDKKTKYLVYGWIRNEQRTLSSFHNNHAFYIIPELVIYHCLFYYYLSEYFNIIHDGAITLNNKQSIKNIKHISTSCYGKIMVEPDECMIHKWEIKIDSCSINRYICIGIHECDNVKPAGGAFYAFSSSYFYAYAAWRQKYYKDSPLSSLIEGFRYGSGDTIYMELDGQKLSFHKKESEEPVVFDDVNQSRKYIVAVYTADKHDMVTIINYTVNYKA